MAKIFVSYSRKDSAAARKLIEQFKTMQMDVWVDWEDIPPAADWLDQILRGIEGIDAFIFLISPDSVASEVCNVEVGHAAKNSKRIIPIVVRDVDPKVAKVNPAIGSLNWIFIREQDQFKEGLDRVRFAIELDLPWVESQTRLQNRALEWHRMKDSSLLLRGNDLRGARLMLVEKDKDPQPTGLQRTFILHSIQDERRRRNFWIATALAALVMAGLAIFASIQSVRANQNAEIAHQNEIIANKNKDAAEQNAELARRNERAAKIEQQKAEKARKVAEENKKIAAAQRSAARAQIYQFKPGELYTSTLLAIDSLQSIASPEAEEILRKNISLLPIPVKRMVHAGSINSLEFNPDGNIFVTAGADRSACVWKVEDGSNLFCTDSAGAVNKAVFTPDGKSVVMGDDTGLVQIVSAQDGTLQNKFEFGVAIWDVDIRRDGRFAAVTRDDGKISMIDLVTRKKSFDLQSAGIKVAAFSPDGLYIAAGSSSGTVTIWNLNEKNKVINITDHKAEVLALEFSPKNSRYVVSGGKDKLAILSEAIRGDELLRIPNEDTVEDIAFSPDGAWFVTVSDDGRIRVWDTVSGRERVRMVQDAVVTRVQVSANSQLIATTGEDRTVRVWNAYTGAEMFQIPIKGKGTALGFSGDGRYLVAGDESGDINLLDISVIATPTNYVQLNGLTNGALFNQNGTLAAVSDDNRVWLLKPQNFSSLMTRAQGNPSLAVKGNVRTFTLSPDSKWMGITTESGNVTIYDVGSQSPKIIIKSGLNHVLAFLPDSRQLITGNSAGAVQMWDAATGKMTATLVEKGSSIHALAVTSTLALLGMQDKIVIMDLKSQLKIAELESSGENANLAFNTDASLLAASDSSGQIHIWKYANGTFSPLPSISKEAIYALAFNPQNDQLAAGATDNVYLIDPLAGKEVARIPHAGAVKGVSFSPDGNTLMTASLKVVQFWDVSKIPQIDSSSLVEVACSRLTTNFSHTEWSSLFGDDPYTPLCRNLPTP